MCCLYFFFFFFFQAEDGIRDTSVTGVQTCALPILGAGGMIWALRRLGSALDLDALAASVLDRYRETPHEDHPGSLFFGETGLLRSEERRVGKECRSGGARAR